MIWLVVATVSAVTLGIFFVSGRIRFYHPDGTAGKYTGGAPSCLVAYGELADRRLLEFKALSGIYVPLNADSA